jgi:tryptophan synthase alpha chain
MSRLQSLFARKKNRILNVYCTAGYPEPGSTNDIIEALSQHGADIIEVGIPYSDPVADGPVIQKSNAISLSNGMSLKKLFSQLKKVRTDTPIILMGYLNPILQYGFENFCRDASHVGIDGLIIPDLPAREYEKEYSSFVSKYKLDFIFLVTPETRAERVKELDRLSSGFLYAVSSSSTTGTSKNNTSMAEYLLKIKNLDLKNPVLVGFGIGTRPAFEEACRYAAGAIIGSAFIKALESSADVKTTTKTFLSSILGN